MKKILLSVATLALATLGLMAQPYYVAGEATLCNGVAWVPGASENEMIDNGSGVYEITFAAIPAGTYQFKVTTGSWPPAGTEWGGDAVDIACSSSGLSPQVAGNITITTTATGDVKVTFDGTKICIEGTFGEWTLNMVTVVCASDMVDDGTGTMIPHPFGGLDGKIITGTGDDPANTANDMVKQVDDSWTKTYTGLALESGAYGCKVVANNSWVKEYPGMNTYQTIEILEAGTYDLAFTFSGDFDNPNLDIVPSPVTSVEETTAATIYAANGTIYADEDITIYNFAGQDVTAQNGALAAGNYIVKTAKGATSIAVK